MKEGASLSEAPSSFAEITSREGLGLNREERSSGGTNRLMWS
jgi:hypothetical protein